jgi:hypothetical protein
VEYYPTDTDPLNFGPRLKIPWLTLKPDTSSHSHTNLSQLPMCQRLAASDGISATRCPKRLAMSAAMRTEMIAQVLGCIDNIWGKCNEYTPAEAR